VLVLSGSVSLPYAAPSIHASTQAQVTSLKLHPEIYITSDSQFTSANGVTGGKGTKSDPYVIQGWEMDASTTSTAGIDIRYTSAYFVIRDVYVHGVTDGIDFLYVVHGRIENTTTANNFNGIMLSSSVADVIDNNTVSGNQEGITVTNSQYIGCYNNTVIGSSSIGITLGGYSTANVNVTDNSVIANDWGLAVTGVKNSTVSRNQIFSSYLGMDLESNSNVLVFENSFVNDGEWIASHFSDVIHVYHNNFFSLTNRPGIYIDAGGSSWDNGYPSGGNYWFDYTGVDNCSGTGQNICPQPDGIGDTPYQIDYLDRDNYPLMKPFGPQPRYAPKWPEGSQLTASNITPNTITLDWTPAIGAVKYRVYEFPRLIANVSGTSFTVTGLAFRASYTFKVEAGDAWSNFTSDGPSLTVRVLPQGAFIEYLASYIGRPYPGGTLKIVNNFTSFGQDSLRVTGLNMSGELGSFSLSSVPIYLSGGESKIANMTIRIPSTVTPGNRTVSLGVTWQYLAPLNGTWVDAPFLTVVGGILVEASPPTAQTQSPPNPGTSSSGPSVQDFSDELIMIVNQYLLPVAAVFWTLSFLGLALVIRDGKKPSTSQFRRFCSNCGTEAEAWNRFCHRCGTQLQIPPSPA
jgi:parallel beta-helix repeat protein